MCRLLGQVITQQRKELTFGWTNSFISVYRLHQLLPDRIAGLGTLKQMIDNNGNQEKLERLGHAGVGALIMNSPLGVPSLNNYPMDLTAQNGFRIDMPAMEIRRDREMKTPRYQEWMKMMGLVIPRKWSDISPRREVQRKLKAIYKRVVNVDLIIGLYAHFDTENIPGHVVVDPSYIMFALQTPMRTWRDKFYIDNRTPAIYTNFGIDYIDTMNFKQVLVRQGHTNVNENPFRPPGTGGGCFKDYGDQCTPKHNFYSSSVLTYNNE